MPDWISLNDSRGHKILFQSGGSERDWKNEHLTLFKADIVEDHIFFELHKIFEDSPPIQAKGLIILQ